MKKKILIIAKSFYPEITPRSFRATELALEFTNQGHSVSVLTHENQELKQFASINKISIIDIGKRKWKVPYFGKSRLGYHLNNLFSIFLQLFFEYPGIEYMFLVKKSLKKINSFDLLISIAVPHPIHWGVARVWSKEIAQKWIADCGDPYSKNPQNRFRKPIYLQMLEKDFCKKTTWITVPIEAAKDGYFNEFQSKIAVIPQGFNFKNIKIGPYVKNDKCMVFAYAGGISLKGPRSPISLIDFLLTLNINFVFNIYTGTGFDVLKPYEQKFPDKIIVTKAIPRNKLIYKLSLMDFLVNFKNRTNVMLPSKLIDYGLAQRPILNISTEHLDSNLIMEFLNQNYSRTLKLDNIQKYNITNVANKFLSLD